MNRVTEHDLARMPWHARERLQRHRPDPLALAVVPLIGWPALWDDSPAAQHRRREILANALDGFRLA